MAHLGRNQRQSWESTSLEWFFSPVQPSNEFRLWPSSLPAEAPNITKQSQATFTGLCLNFCPFETKMIGTFLYIIITIQCLLVLEQLITNTRHTATGKLVRLREGPLVVTTGKDKVVFLPNRTLGEINNRSCWRPPYEHIAWGKKTNL